MAQYTNFYIGGKLMSNSQAGQSLDPVTFEVLKNSFIKIKRNFLRTNY